MTQAITTKYHGPTNTRGARITAAAWAGRVSIPYPHSLRTEEAHAKAARALIEKMGWHGEWVAGATETGFVFVQTVAPDAVLTVEAAQ